MIKSVRISVCLLLLSIAFGVSCAKKESTPTALPQPTPLRKTVKALSTQWILATGNSKISELDLSKVNFNNYGPQSIKLKLASGTKCDCQLDVQVLQLSGVVDCGAASFECDDVTGYRFGVEKSGASEMCWFEEAVYSDLIAEGIAGNAAQERAIVCYR